MKKICLFIILPLLSLSAALAQCSKTYPYTGVYPDTLAKGREGVPFEAEIDFTLPRDTFSVTIDSLKLLSVKGFPGSFSVTCGVASCVYTAPSSGPYQGCLILKGTPPAGSAGTYKITVTFEVYFQTPFGGQTLGYSDSSTTFEVEACNVVSAITAKTDTAICPGGSVTFEGPTGGYAYTWLHKGNPYQGLTTQSISARDSGIYSLVLRDTTTGCNDTSEFRTVVFNPVPAKPVISIMKTNPPYLSAGAVSGVTNTWQYRSATGTWGNLTQTGDTIQNPANGWYRVQSKNGTNCESVWSDSVEYIQSSSNKINDIFASRISIYPNPAHNEVQLQLIQGIQMQIRITDAAGRLVYQSVSNGNHSITVRTTEWARGNYLVTFQGPDGLYHQSLLLQ